MQTSADSVREFFQWSDTLDYLVLRPLSHIRSNWETRWDSDKRKYRPEEDSFAEELNELIERIASTNPPLRYHDNEDRLAEFVQSKGWRIKKAGNRWVGTDYASILEQGAFDDHDIPNLLLAARGRVHAAVVRGQTHFDEMEESHQKMLAAVLAIAIYHRECGTW